MSVCVCARAHGYMMCCFVRVHLASRATLPKSFLKMCPFTSPDLIVCQNVYLASMQHDFLQNYTNKIYENLSTIINAIKQTKRSHHISVKF